MNVFIGNAPAWIPSAWRQRVGHASAWLGIWVAATCAALPARADDGPMLPAPRPSAPDITETALIGAGGQVYLYDPTSKTPRWVRRVAGGCTADITSAVVLPAVVTNKTSSVEPTSLQILVAGKSAPLFRWANGTWSSMPVGQKGKPIVGTGPLPSVAIDRQVFVWQNDRMIRVATAPSTVVGVWAASTTDVRVSTDKTLLRLRGKAFAPVALGSQQFSLGRIIGGSKPLLITGSKLIDLERGRSTNVGGPVQLASAASTGGGTNATTFAAVVLPSTDNTLALKLFTFTGAAPATSINIAGPIGARAPVALLVDRTGQILLTTATTSWLFQNSAWAAISIESELGPSKTGPGPAFTQ